MPRGLILGFRGFVVVWLGQSVSLIGSGMTRFAFTLWAFEETGSAAVLSGVAFFNFAPTILLSPLAGALVDRSNRKAIMIFADTAAAVSTLILLALFASGALQIWHLFLTGFIAASVEAFQFPAFSAAVTMMVDKSHYGRSSAMRGIAESSSIIFAPILGGALYGLIDLGGIMLLDLATFAFAFCTLLLVVIPQPLETAEGQAGRGSLWSESLYGFRYVWERRSLVGMQAIFSAVNFFFSMTLILLPAMILAKTNNDALTLATANSSLGVGGLVGGVLVSVLGVPRRRVHGVFIGMMSIGLLGLIPLGMGDTLPIWIMGGFLGSCFIPLVDGSNQAIWQSKVAPDVQGRVFAVRRVIAQFTIPAGMLAGGFLADFVFEPAMAPNGILAPILGGLIGTGVGEGMGLLIVLAGFGSTIAGLAGFAFPFIYQIEDILPDYE